MRLSTIPACFALAGILVSCGGDSGSDAAGDSGPGEAAVPSGREASAAPARMADMGDFPIPAAPGAVEILGGPAMFLISYPLEDYDRVAQFYEDWVAGQSEEYQRVDASETLGPEIRGLSWLTSDGSRMITVAEESEADYEDADDPNTVVQLSASNSQ